MSSYISSSIPQAYTSNGLCFTQQVEVDAEDLLIVYLPLNQLILIDTMRCDPHNALTILCDLSSAPTLLTPTDPLLKRGLFKTVPITDPSFSFHLTKGHLQQ